MVELGSTLGDFGVEGLDADAELFGFGSAHPIVFGGRKLGKAGKGF